MYIQKSYLLVGIVSYLDTKSVAGKHALNLSTNVTFFIFEILYHVSA